MSKLFLALLWTGLVPARLGAVQVEVRTVSTPVALNVFAPGVQTPSLGVLPAPSLSPGLLAPAAPVLTPVVALQPLAAAPEDPASAPVPVLSALQDWKSRILEPSAPVAPALSSLWDGTRFKSAAPEMSGVAEVTPGSIFDWKPVAQSPGHGVPLLDRWARRILGREDGRFNAGYEMSNAARREDAREFLYGERHTDKDLIRENMRRIASDIRPGKGAVVLDEGYFGPRLFGSAAIEYLEKKGLDPEWLGPEAAFGAGIEVAGWDDKDIYDESKHPLLQHHMNMLDLTGHLYSPQQGWGYYCELASKGWETFKNWVVLRRLAITRRNLVLDRSVKAALEQAQRSGRSLHVIAGAEHLVQRPLLSGVPWLGRFRVRRSLVQALGGQPYWVGKPADTPSQ